MKVPGENCSRASDLERDGSQNGSHMNLKLWMKHAEVIGNANVKVIRMSG